MLSIEEIIKKTIDQRHRIEKAMDSYGYYHPNAKVPGEGIADITADMKLADAQAVRESIHNIPLSEFLAKSGTTGISGAAYLVPVKAHDLALYYSGVTDHVPAICRQVIHDWKGDEWKLSVADDAAYTPHPLSSGGKLPDMSGDFTQVTMEFDKDRTLGLSVTAGLDALEDITDYDVLEWHIQQAAVAFGKMATNRALTVLAAAGDGVGTLNSSATGDADETKLTSGTTSDVVTAFRKVSEDEFTSNTLICTGEAWGHSISMQASPTGWDSLTPSQGFHNKIGVLDILYCNHASLHAITDLAEAAYTNCITLVFDRNNALVTGRKRWLSLTEYAQPVKDLAGAVIVGAQDSVTLYKDSIYKLTET